MAVRDRFSLFALLSMVMHLGLAGCDAGAGAGGDDPLGGGAGREGAILDVPASVEGLLRNASTGDCLENAGFSGVRTFRCVAEWVNQRWTLEGTRARALHRIVSRSRGECLELVGVESGTAASLSPCIEPPNATDPRAKAQLWRLEPLGDGAFRIRHANTRRCLHPTADGGNVVQVECNASDTAQVWRAE